jgi:hypothetical protein
MLATPPVLLHANYSPKAAIPRSLQECAAKSFSWSIPTTGPLRSARSAFSGSAPASPPACSCCGGARRLAGASAFPVRLDARRLLRIRCVRLTPLTFRSPAARLPERRVSSASSQAPSLCFANLIIGIFSRVLTCDWCLCSANAFAARSRDRSPNVCCNLHHPFKLLPLASFRDGDMVKASETALRADRELIQWKVLRSLVKPSLQQVRGLDILALCADQADDCYGFARDVLERAKSARTVIIVF